MDPKDRPLSALPSVPARLLAFAAILVAGVCGGLIGAAVVNVGCRGSCTAAGGAGAVVGAVVAAGGVAVVAALFLRSVGEWRSQHPAGTEAGAEAGAEPGAEAGAGSDPNGGSDWGSESGSDWDLPEP